jgi:hypothetical protein
VVVKVSLNDRSEPLASLLNRIVLAGEELLLDLPQLCSHPLARRLPQDHEAPLLARLPAQVRETEKVERLRFLLSTLFPISFGMCLASTILPGQRQLFFPTGDNYQLCKAALLA